VRGVAPLPVDSGDGEVLSLDIVGLRRVPEVSLLASEDGATPVLGGVPAARP